MHQSAAKESGDDALREEEAARAGTEGAAAAAAGAAGSVDGKVGAKEGEEKARAAAAKVVVGQTRCRDSSGYVATVWYDGPVPSQKKKTNEVERRRYLGVVWDDPDRGRHNGTLPDPATGRLVAYFAPPPGTARPATCASFVAPSRLDFGRALTFGLMLERYRRNLEEGWWDDHSVRCARESTTKAVEFVGADKIVSQQQVEALRTISLRFMGINSIPATASQMLPAGAKDDEAAAGESANADDSAAALLSKLSTRDDDNNDESIEAKKLELCVHVDLAGNLLTDWMDLKRLLSVMPQLRHVSVSHNRFLDATLDSAAAQPPPSWSESLVQLNLGRCNIRTARTLTALGRALPRLESLCCAHAGLDDLEACCARPEGASAPPGEPPLGRVRDLDATGCGLTREQLPFLSALFPSVSHLNLTGNPVESWPKSNRPASHSSYPSSATDEGIAAGAGLLFPRLTHLQWTLSRRYCPRRPGVFQADLMDDLQPLVDSHHDRLVGLRLELGGDPARSDDASPPSPFPVPCKMLLIASLGKLEVWNGGRLSYHERRDAEIYLLRHYGRDGEPEFRRIGDGSSPALRAFRCPRHSELQRSHPDALRPLGGALGDSPGAGGGGAMNLVTVELRSLCPHSCERPPVIRRLPANLTLGKLKAMLGKQFDLDADLQELSWIVASPDNGGGGREPGQGRQRRPQQMATPLNEPDSATLERCGLVHGAIVFMNERVITPSEKEEHRFLQKIQQQEEQRARFEQRKRAVAEGAI